MKRLVIGLAFSLLALVGAQAQVIYQQLPTAGSSGYLSSTFINGGSNGEEFVWDSFNTPTTQTLREIQWRGVRSGVQPSDFQISINTIALAGSTTWHTNGSASETPTGTPGVYDYKFTLPAGFVLTGGQGYWLQVIGLQNGFFDWRWSAANGGNGSHVAQVPAITGDYRFIYAGGDVAFTLLNQATVPVTINVTALPAAGGTVAGGGTFAPGTNVTLTATPAAGRTFLNWTEAGVAVSNTASFSFAADGNKTVSANFSGPNTGPYVITAIANPSISGNIGGAGTFNAGEIVTLDATPADFMTLVSWTENNVVVSTNPIYSFTATKDRVIQANFTDPLGTYFIYGNPVPWTVGSIVINGTAGLSSGTFNGGTIITYTATPYAGYHFVNWKQGADVGGAQRIIGTSNTLTHVVVYATSITATFEPDFPVLTLSASPAGTGTLSGAATYANNSNVTVNAVPAVGYVFSSWKQGTTVMSTSASYSFPITDHTSLTAFFTAQNRTITASAAPVAEGSVTGAGVVGNGATVTLTVSPNAGHVFTGWTLDGAAAGNTNPLVFNANANHAFVANFAPGYTINVTVPTGVGGSIGGIGTYAVGSSVTLTATATAGYAFTGWSVNGTPVSTAAAYTFTPATSLLFEANFALIIPQVNVAASIPSTFVIAWPAALPGWVLQQSPDLSPGSWVDSTLTITTTGGQKSASVPNPSGRLFFRLSHP